MPSTLSYQQMLSNRFHVDGTALNWFKSDVIDWTQLTTHACRQKSSSLIECSVFCPLSRCDLPSLCGACDINVWCRWRHCCSKPTT